MSGCNEVVCSFKFIVLSMLLLMTTKNVNMVDLMTQLKY
jgi:hypothetical protein